MEYAHSQIMMTEFQCLCFRLGQLKDSIDQEFGSLLAIYKQPHVYLRPAITLDGNKYIALLGANLQEGIAASGDTPQQAAQAWDLVWLNGEQLKKKD